MLRLMFVSDKIWLPLAWVGIIAVVIYITIYTVMPVTGRMSYGFIGRYTASSLLVQGKFGPQVYQDDWFSHQVQTISKTSYIEIFTPNPPSLSLLTLPFVWLSFQTARDVWIWSNLLLLLITTGILIIALQHLQYTSTQIAWGLLPALIVVIPAAAANFRVGQVYILLLCLFVLALWGILTGRDWLTGLALGLAFVFKTSGLWLWLLLLVCRRWRALVWGVGTILGVVLLSLPWIGLDTWLAYPQAVLGFSQRGAVSSPAYQTTTGFFRHMFQFDPVFNPTPVRHWPYLAKFLTGMVTLGSIGITLWLGWTKSLVGGFFAALIPLSIILLPVAEEYHFVLLFIPIAMSVAYLLSLGRNGNILLWGILVAALLLLVLPIPYKTATLSRNWWGLLAYPRLYGAWLIWLITLQATREYGVGSKE